MERTAEPGLARPRVKYKRAPIQEAICEIHFKLPQPLDKTALEKMQQQWMAQYPQQNIVTERQLELHFALDKMESSQREMGHKLITRSSDEKNLAQLGPAFLAVNRLNPYLGWEESFRDLILDRFREVAAVFAFEAIERVGLRYINRIDFPQRPLRWSEWLAVSPPVPETLRETGGDFQLLYRQALGDRLSCQINFGTVMPPTADVTSVLLDIDVIWRGEMPRSEVAEGLEKVHRPHRDLFEGYLLDKTRALFYTTT
jgi:uncharacterized protein (TIGR04255 family)